MEKRVARQRHEYLYRKAVEARDASDLKRTKMLQDAIADGKQLSGQARKDSTTSKALTYDQGAAALSLPSPSHLDDEYARVGEMDPKVLITTSRDPSSKLTQFTKEMKLMIPGGQRVNRGNYVLGEIVEACRAAGATDLIVFHEHRGQPDGMVITHFPHGPTTHFTLHNVVPRHDIPDRGTVSEQYPHLIMDGFETKVGKRVRDILRALFPVPKEEATRVMTFANNSDFISFRHHVFQKVGGEVSLVEVGPRFEMQVYQIKLGTMDMKEAETEWVYRPYMNTANKRDIL